MTISAGIDLLRGRPTPAIGSTEAKLQQRKLDALKRGIHRIADVSALPFGVHLVGIGGAGIRLVEQFLRDAPSDLLDVPGSRLSVLALDIGDQDLHGVRALADRFPQERSQIEAIALDLPGAGELASSVSRYREFLQLEYPLYYAHPDSDAWLPANLVANAKAGEPLPRAVAKAVYGRAYYDGDRPLHAALKRFARSVEQTGGDAVVCLVFGLGGGTGSGIAPDLARHLSNGIFGRRVLVTGIGLAPHDADAADRDPAGMFPVFAELDSLCDDEKNRGITLSCGDLYKNPFTAGFVVVPQPAGGDRLATRRRVNQELANFLWQRRGANLWEALRLLNWVAAPSTQHSAARTPWGERWIHLFGFGDGQHAPSHFDARAMLGLLPGYAPEFVEMRAAASADASAGWALALNAALAPEVPTHVVAGAQPGSVQFLLPRLAKTDLAVFFSARAAYDALSLGERHALHALLLERGLLLCEPSRRLDGMAGASLGSGADGAWIAVPLADLRGPADVPQSASAPRPEATPPAPHSETSKVAVPRLLMRT